MDVSKNRFTLKILLSYLVLGALAVLVAIFLYSELKSFSAQNAEVGEKKFLETGTLINLVYETEGFSRWALLTEDEGDFERYMSRTDSLY